MKVYTAASADLEVTIKNMIEQHHEELRSVRVAALFRCDDEDSLLPTLTHNGYPAAAVVKITNLRDRALGMADAVIVVDRAEWIGMLFGQKNALIDHELTHLRPRRDPETDAPLFDALGRPLLMMRRHDRQFGWFDEVAERHGANSFEVRQAKDLIQSASQLYFEFGPAPVTDTSGDSLSPQQERASTLQEIRDLLARLDVHVSLGALQARSAEDILAATVWARWIVEGRKGSDKLSRPTWLPQPGDKSQAA